MATTAVTCPNAQRSQSDATMIPLFAGDTEIECGNVHSKRGANITDVPNRESSSAVHYAIGEKIRF
jgi:hypothetical protein